MLTRFLGAPSFTALCVIAVSLLICLNARTIGQRLKLIDAPDDTRKHHREPTPLVGGIAIVIPLTLWLCAALTFFPSGDLALQTVLLLCGLGVSLVGFADDQSNTLPLGRTLSLLVFLSVAFVVDPAFIAPVLKWGSFMPTEIPLWAYGAIMAVAAVGLVNAVNMADGQNGIVSGMFVIWSACLWIVTKGSVDACVILLATSLIAFLFNLRGKLFLGNCGSYGGTFIFALLTIWAHAKGLVSVETITVWFFVPVADCLRLIIARPLQGRSPLEADRDHFHHRVQAKLGPRYSLSTYIGVVAVTSVVASLAPHLALVCIVILSAFYFSFAWLTDSALASAADHSRKHGAHTHAPRHNVVSLSESAKDGARSKPHNR